VEINILQAAIFFKEVIMNTAGIIRCQQTEDMCQGLTDFKVATKGILAFEETGPVIITGFVSCGGCPGKKAVNRAKMMVDRGANIIALASCIGKGNPIGFPCPHFDKIRDAILKTIGSDVKVLDWTH
jgi:predicted metal-binding protein